MEKKRSGRFTGESERISGWRRASQITGAIPFCPHLFSPALGRCFIHRALATVIPAHSSRCCFHSWHHHSLSPYPIPQSGWQNLFQGHRALSQARRFFKTKLIHYFRRDFQLFFVNSIYLDPFSLCSLKPFSFPHPPDSSLIDLLVPSSSFPSYSMRSGQLRFGAQVPGPNLSAVHQYLKSEPITRCPSGFITL